MVQRFLRPASPAEALQLRKDTGGVFLAGGTDLNVMGSPDTAAVVSLAALSLGFLRTDGPTVEIGSMVTLQELADHEALSQVGLDVLRRAARHVGIRSIRNLATLGGCVGANKAYSDLIPALVALDGGLTLATDSGERVMTVEQYVASPDSQALIVAVQVPRPASGSQIVLERFARSANDLPVVNIALSLGLVEGQILTPRLAIGGVAPTVARVPEAEAVLSGSDVSEIPSGVADRFAKAVADHVRPDGDQRGSASFRADLAAKLARRALGECIKEKGG